MNTSFLKIGLLGLMGVFGAGVAMVGLTPQDTLATGPRVPGPYGPLSASDANRDGQVTRAEMEAFVSRGPERQMGMVAYFDRHDVDADNILTADELALVEPPYAFDGSDLNADGTVSRREVEAYVSERLYRQMDLLTFFDLVDTDANGIVVEDEMIAAQMAGQLPIEDI
ncbi:EF-hand domain-containing protein [Jannaschia donghaensis]|uniref:EF hand n=1 Tax=Jannaschia donghaensis TaxID=420998 RepID=A0A0M6YL59_9RHOB|nr:hypothetical protein [Jannaschia donghaensis]CTQ49786.1 EF hand [Jannaschia donghaensis]